MPTDTTMQAPNPSPSLGGQMGINLVSQLGSNSLVAAFYNTILGQQTSSAKELAELQYNNNLKMWNATNYSAQVEHMKRAGLNPALMYKGGGPGGQMSGGTPGAPSGTGGQNARNIMGIADQVMLAKLQAETENIKADTQNKLSGAGNLDANTTLTGLKAIQQGFENEMSKINSEILTNTKVDKTLQIQANARQAVAQMESAETKADIDQATKENEIDRIGYESIGAMLKNQATIQGINLSKRQERAITEQLNQGFQQILINQRNSNTNEKNAETNLYQQLQDQRYKEALIQLGNDKLTQDMLMGVAGMAVGKLPTTTTSTTIGNNAGKTTTTTRK